MCTFNQSRHLNSKTTTLTKIISNTTTLFYLCKEKYIQLKRFTQQLLHPFTKRKTRKKYIDKNQNNNNNNNNNSNSKKASRMKMQNLTKIVKMCSRNIKISVVLFLVLIPLITALPHSHRVSKRSSFFDLECKGIYNKTMFFRLDRICDDCYQLFREPTIHRLCKSKCYVTEWFGDCLKALLIPAEEVQEFEHFVKVVNGLRIDQLNITNQT